MIHQPAVAAIPKELVFMIHFGYQLRPRNINSAGSAMITMTSWPSSTPILNATTVSSGSAPPSLNNSARTLAKPIPCNNPKTNTSNEVKNLIDKKRSFNKQYGYGYRVQIYYGEETKARSIENKFKINFPNVYTKLDYDQPYWKVQVGNYKTKLEADKAVINFSEKFSGLIVIPLGK